MRTGNGAIHPHDPVIYGDGNLTAVLGTVMKCMYMCRPTRKTENKHLSLHSPVAAKP